MEKLAFELIRHVLEFSGLSAKDFISLFLVSKTWYKLFMNSRLQFHFLSTSKMICQSLHWNHHCLDISAFPVFHDCYNCAPLNKNFQKQLELSSSHLSKFYGLRFAITSLYVNSLTDFLQSPTQISYFPTFHSLQCLTLNLSIDDILPIHLKVPPNIETLTLVFIRPLIQFIHPTKQTRKINLRLGKLIQNCRKLKHLNITNVKCGFNLAYYDVIFPRLFINLQRCDLKEQNFKEQNLESISLPACKASLEWLLFSFHLFKKSKCFKIIFPNCFLSALTMSGFVNKLHLLQRFQSLHLELFFIHENDMYWDQIEQCQELLFKKLGQLPLQTLRLHHTSLGFSFFKQCHFTFWQNTLIGSTLQSLKLNISVDQYDFDLFYWLGTCAQVLKELDLIFELYSDFWTAFENDNLNNLNNLNNLERNNIYHWNFSLPRHPCKLHTTLEYLSTNSCGLGLTIEITPFELKEIQTHFIKLKKWEKYH